MGVTILLITHQMQVIQMICNKVAVMGNGQIVEQGTVLDVFSQPHAPVTQEFVRTVINDQIPKSILDLLQTETRHYVIDRLKFIGASVKNRSFPRFARLPAWRLISLVQPFRSLGKASCVFSSCKCLVPMTSCSRPKHRSTRLEFSAKGWYSTDGSSVGNKIFKVSVERLLLNGGQTLYMVGIALLIGTVLGTLLALVLVLCRKGGLVENKVLHSIVSLYINVVRSVPFIILLVTIMPLTRAILGTTIGSTAALVPLVVYISPYLARLIENSLLEVSPGILEAAQAMGATTWQIIRCFLMPEALGSMVLALTTGTVGLLGASAMAGYCGGGGVGDLALTYGYEKMNTPLMIVTVIVLVILVQLLQMAGNRVSRRLREHR